MFINRRAELDFLQNVLTRKRPGPGQLILLYGRRRVGKTALLRHWAEGSGVPWIYWMAQREPAALQRRRLTAALLGRNPAATDTPTFDSWPDLCRLSHDMVDTYSDFDWQMPSLSDAICF